ncbi:glutamate racemase [Paenibacillus sp. FSL A5-0031]|uniref:glutamate racemase n=1 Tax=Paenibacillus sp. FSL A5-0031 TaxID=1920420 RepID=UPI00096C032C|nr:glutamate racemase [Paenibacillus sp. FSL A5-0031]OME75917.1 glutamate racemase [Paenibacillus sp. FSL A5-0031]
MSIGIFDSGIGGVTVLHQALRLMPNENYIFYSDPLNAPYGEKSREDIKKYTFQAAEFLAAQNIKALVIACNTATSVAIEDLRNRYEFPIVGIEPAIKPAVRKWQGSKKNIMVLATNLTLREKKYTNLLKSLELEDNVKGVALPGLVDFAERLEFREEKVIPYLKQMLVSYRLEEYDTVVLGCTHFPYFINSIRTVFPSGVEILSGNYGTVNRLKNILNISNQDNKGKGSIVYYQSGLKVEDTAVLAVFSDLIKTLDHIQ